MKNNKQIKNKRKKKTIKINFRHFWVNFDSNDNFYTNMLKKDYNVVISDKPDYVFYSVYDRSSPSCSKHFGGIGRFVNKKAPALYRLLKKLYFSVKTEWKMPVLEGDFVKIFVGVENSIPDMDKCDWAFTNCYDEELKNPRHLRLPPYKFGYDPFLKYLIKKN